MIYTCTRVCENFVEKLFLAIEKLNLCVLTILMSTVYLIELKPEQIAVKPFAGNIKQNKNPAESLTFCMKVCIAVAIYGITQ